jgi:DNA-directed RNA polymerase specialized sigma subunit
VTTGTTYGAAKTMRKNNKSVIAFSMDKIMHSEDYKDHEHQFEDKRINPKLDEIKELVDQIISKIPERDTRFLFTLIFKKGMTMKEAGKALGVSESRTSQMVKAQLAIIRNREGVRGTFDLRVLRGQWRKPVAA